jgi:hypothetical protein
VLVLTAAIDRRSPSQALLGLPPAKREAVRDEVRALIAPFERDGRLMIDVETLIGVGTKD